jgi:hypothetical protein
MILRGATTYLTKTGLYCKLDISSKPNRFANQLEVAPMKNFANPTRLSELQTQAALHTALEPLRHQDRAALRQSLSAILAVLGHWTVGISAPRVAKLGGVK